MKNNIKFLLLVVVASLMLSGCIKETLPMNSTATSDQIGGSESGLQAMVSSLNTQMIVYNTLGIVTEDDRQHWDFGYPSLCMSRDLMCNDMATYTTSYHQFRNWEGNLYLSGEYIASRFAWTYYYKVVYLANSILAVRAEGEFAGIARVYRAMAYLDMVRLYDFKKNNYTEGPSDIAVPIVTEKTTEAMAANNPRAATKDVYAMVIEDLKFAETALAKYTRPAKNTPDITVVWGLMARAYLEQGSRFSDKAAFEQAAIYARKVIASGKYTPLKEDDWTSKTAAFNDNTSQTSWLWSINITKEDRVVTTGICNFMAMISSECTFGYALANGKESPQKCIDKKFYESIPDTDFRKKVWMAPDYSNASMAIAGKAWANENLDPYVQFKFRPGQGDTENNLIAAAADYPLMRVEEMYLIEAEAKGLAGGDGKSLLESFVTTYRNPTYAYDDSKTLSENVLQQKRIEFWGEGLVFFDYKRLNKGVERGYADTNHYDVTRFNTNGVAPWFNFCINVNELRSNSGITSATNNPDPTSTVPLWEE